MLHKKLIIVLFAFKLNICFGYFCEICPDHTLCKYPIPGPSQRCKNYDTNSLLTQNDIIDILVKINEKRNFIALGLTKNFPQAANMRKIHWSVDLAIFAQRWVDQCDPMIRPDLEDNCRDLEFYKSIPMPSTEEQSFQGVWLANARCALLALEASQVLRERTVSQTKSVGQNIATVLGETPGLSVKSYIEMWYMQMMDYSGSVTFYNQSNDHNTKYFTQLIWAETDMVGCGKAKFYANETIVERLVCNFAMRGNINGHPIYAIGYPATQCPRNMKPDDVFEGLCVYDDKLWETKKPIELASSTFSTTNSFLRIFMPSSNGTQKELILIPPGKSIKTSNINKDARYQKARHIPMFINNSFIPTMLPLRIHGVQDEHQHDKGHSKIHHIHDIENILVKDNKIVGQPYNRRVQTQSDIPSLIDGRRHNINNQCTRKDLLFTTSCNSNQCTRGRMSPKCFEVISNDPCPCSQAPCQTTSTSCHCHCIEPNIKSQCQTHNCEGIPEYGRRSFNIKNEEGNELQTGNPDSKMFATTFKNDNIFNNHQPMNNYNIIQKQIHRPPISQSFQGDPYNSFDFYKRRRRKRQDPLNLKPFWQIEKFEDHKNDEFLKSLRYTTLSRNKNKKSRKTTTAKSAPSDMITVEMNRRSKLHPDGTITEKYLSFDELMHIRKLNTPDDDSKDFVPELARRHNVEILRDDKKATTQAPTTTEATTASVSPPFKRLKYCTRKLTCTWTMPTGPDGKANGNGGNPNGRGSKTPPGYVDGCTRTSTCTRDFLERNKMEIIENMNHTSDDEGDEDYCEKKSLNIRRRDSDEKPLLLEKLRKETTKNYVLLERLDKNLEYNAENIFDISNQCTCRQKRKKRFNKDQLLLKSNSRKLENTIRSNLSYENLLKIIVNRIRKSHSKHCLCNLSNNVHINHNFIIVLMTSFLFICNI